MKRSSSRIETLRVLRVEEEAKQKELEKIEIEIQVKKWEEREKAKKEKKLMLQELLRQKAEEERMKKKIRLKESNDETKKKKKEDREEDILDLGACDDSTGTATTQSISVSAESGNGSLNVKKQIPAKKKRTMHKIKFKPKIKREEIDISNTTVEIVTATAAQIRKSRSSNVNTNNTQKQKKQLVLVQIPSNKERSYIYEETARAIAIKECQALPTHGGRSWTSIITISDEHGACGSASSMEGEVQGVIFQHKVSMNNKKGDKKKQKGKKLKSPLFRWYRGRLELAILPHILNEIDVIDTKHGLLKSVKEEYETALSSLQQSEKATDLTSRQVTTLSTIAWNDDEYSLPKVERKWISPDHVIFKSRSKTIEHCCLLDERDKLIDKVLHGIGLRGATIRPVKPTRKQALEAGYYRFLRDGLWMIGQEEEWIKDRFDELNASLENNKGKEGNRNGAVKEEQSQKLITNIDTGAMSKVAANDKLEVLATNVLPNDTVIKSNENMIGEQTSMASSIKGVPKEEQTCDEINGSPKAVLIGSKSQIIGTNHTHRKEIIKTSTMVTAKIDTDFVNNKEKKNDKHSSDDSSVDLQHQSAFKTSGSKSNSLDMKCLDEKVSLKSNVKEKQIVSPNQGSILKSKHQHKFVPSYHWRLTPAQIELCYNAIMEFYEKVLYTVKARALHSELANGFDIFRERGIGRYDMQLPIFDTEQFSFLTHTDAAWMPVVKKILGDDATIVHKGAFLSMPGSATQVYHQDGLHLTTKCHRPAHAINVFIPLVALNMQNGPTEFCVGTHILGNEHYRKEFIDIPLASAGSPIIFDYRLGHRGLGNSSQHPRPIVYLTYSTASKEFRDSVNFSRKRYKKLGDLIDIPLSRQERALKRARG